MNTSKVSDDDTARTCEDAARQRAENLACLGAKTVLELCVGPSLEILEHYYNQVGIEVTGNDIDPRWETYYPQGNWMIGDCFSFHWYDHTPPYDAFDAVVFAPPLSKGCTGKREDALSINEVFPRYIDFMRKPFKGIRCMVLPARTFATRQDRKEFFDLTFDLGEIDVVPLTAGPRRIRKYVDVYYRT
jgi:hypothetical protein